jgi:plasmid stabilization system protein ParE
MVQISWSDLAVDDLRSIYDFIANDSAFYAERQIARFIERTEQLMAFPESGRVVPEFNDKNLRELIEGNYRIIYSL